MTLSTAHIIECLAIPDFDGTAILLEGQFGVEEQTLFRILVENFRIVVIVWFSGFAAELRLKLLEMHPAPPSHPVRQVMMESKSHTERDRREREKEADVYRHTAKDTEKDRYTEVDTERHSWSTVPCPGGKLSD